MNQANRRREPRYAINLSVTVLTMDSQKRITAFTTKNMSVGGLLVQSDDAFSQSVGHQMQMTIYLHKSRKDQNIHFKAQIMHQDPSDNIHGLKIIEISEDEKHKLENFIEVVSQTSQIVP